MDSAWVYAQYMHIELGATSATSEGHEFVVAQLRHCFSGDKSFAPAGFLESLEKFTSDKGKAEKHMKRLSCIHAANFAVEGRGIATDKIRSITNELYE